jgi:hypothetical protein
VSRFRQNATATDCVALPRMGVSGQSPAVGSIASAGARRDRHGQGVPTSRSSRCEHQLACPLLGQVSVFRADWAEKRAWKGATFQRFAAGCARRATFQRFAGWLRKAGYVSTFRGDVAAARDRRAASGEADRLLRVRERALTGRPAQRTSRAGSPRWLTLAQRMSASSRTGLSRLESAPQNPLSSVTKLSDSGREQIVKLAARGTPQPRSGVVCQGDKIGVFATSVVLGQMPANARPSLA